MSMLLVITTEGKVLQGPALLTQAAVMSDIGAAVYNDVIFAFGGMADALDDGAHNNAGKVTTTDTPTTAASTTAEPTRSSTL